MSGFDYKSGDKIAEAIDRRIVSVAKQVYEKSPNNKTKYGKVLSKKDGLFTVEIEKAVYPNVPALRNVGNINIGEVVVCMVPNNQFSNIMVMGVADGTIDTTSSSGSSVNVIDNVNSSSSTDALSANQGRVLNEKISTINSNITKIEDKLVSKTSELENDGDGISPFATVDYVNQNAGGESYDDTEIRGLIDNIEENKADKTELENYYTKTETDGLASTLQANVEKKLTRVDNATTMQVYAVSDNGSQTMVRVAKSVIADALVRRIGQHIQVPLIPTNDNYATSKSYVDNLVSTIPKFSVEVVSALPTENISTTTVYLVASGSEEQNLYIEYIYVNDTWEKLGEQTIDLSNYPTIEEMNTAIADYLSNYYTSEQVDGIVSTLQESVNKKLDRVDGSTSTALYGVGNSGQQVMFSVAQGTGTNTIVRRSGQQIKVPLTPDADNDAASKSYVDGLVNGIEIPDDYLPDTTKYGANIDLTIDSTTYVITAQLKDQDGNNLGDAKTIDLPLESVVVSGSYDNATKKVVLTLKDGSKVEFSVADLVSGLQSEITDLDTIRSNASAGKSASDTIAGYGDIVGYNKQEVVNEAKTKYKKVVSLPTSTEIEDNTIYLLQHITDTGIYYTEHIYTNGSWEQFGSNADVDIVGILDNTKKIAISTGGFSAGSSSNVTGTGGAIGKYAQATRGGAIGESATTGLGFAGGYNAKTIKTLEDGISTSPSDAIQLGTGTNKKEKSLQVYDDNIYDASTHTLTVKNIELDGEDIKDKIGAGGTKIIWRVWE